MALSEIDKRWIYLNRFGTKISRADCIATLNNHEFILANSWNKGDEDGLHKYNIHKNEWTQIMHYSRNEEMQITNIAIGQGTQKNKIYLSDYMNANLMVYDIKTQRLSTINSNHGWYSFMVNVNDKLHCIAVDEKSKHIVWNPHDNKTVILHDFTENGCEQMYDGRAVYVASKDMILLIGGMEHNGDMIGIWKYCLVTKKWGKLISGSEFDFHEISVCLTSDEEYVIIGGGTNEDGDSMDKLYALDIRKEDEYKLMECNISLPMDEFDHMVRSGGGLRMKYW